MVIEKRFYDLAKAEWDEIAEEVRQEEENRTEAEREIKERQAKKELQEIYWKGEEYASRWKRVSDEKQIRLFQKITEHALWMAGRISCNITVEEKENSLGKISLESDGFVITSFGSRAVNTVFSNLFLTADDVYAGVSPAGLCKMEFCFRLDREIPADQII